MALNLQNVASRVVVLKFQEELEKRRQQVAATPTPQPTPAPRPVPVPGVSEAALQARARMPQIGVPNPLDLLRNRSIQAGLRAAVPGDLAAQFRLAQAGQQAAGPVLEPYQRHVVEPLAGGLWTGIRTAASSGMGGPIGVPGGGIGTGRPVEVPTSWSGMRQAYQEAPTLTKLPLSLAADPLNLLPFAPAALRKAGTLAELARPGIEAKAAELYPTVREAAVGARGEAGGLKLPFGKKAVEVAEKPRAYVGSLRPFEEVQAEVVTTDNPVIKAALAKTGINPSIAETTPVGKTVVAASRQEVAAEELTKVAMSSLDSRAQRFTGRTTNFNVDDVGQVRNVVTREGQSRAWNDVFSHPDDYSLSRAQRDEIDVFTSVRREADQIRIETGLKPLGVEAEGTIYVPRQVKSIGGVELRRPSNPKYERIWESAQDAIDNAVKYDNPRGTLEIYVRAAYKDVIQKQLADALEPLSLAPNRLIPTEIIERRLAAFKQKLAAESNLGRKQRSSTWWRAGEKWRGKLTTATAEKRALREPDLAAVNARLDAADKDIAQLEGQIQYRRGRASVPSPNVKDEKRLTFLRQWKQDMGANVKEWQTAQTSTEKAAKLRVIERDMTKWDARQSELIAERDAAQLTVEEARHEYNIAKRAYGRAAEAARHKETTSGNFWGKSQSETIPVTMWHNRYFVRADAEKLLQNYGGLQATPRKAGMIGRGFEQTGNIIRFGASVGDFATPFVQNLPLLFRVPVRWGYTAMKHYQAFFDPTVQSRYIANHLETFQKMARNGVPIGDPEFFKALEMGQMPSVGKPLEAIPKVGKAARQTARAIGKQTFGRFQSSYNVNLGIGRSQLWEATEKGWVEGEAELATYIRNMTGGLDSRALGVGPEQRALESTWAAFSPRLLRSTVSLVGDALKTPLKLAVGMTPKQRELESARTMLQLAAGAAGIYVLVGKGLGKSNEEIARGLNPLGGKRFLSHQINGDWIGVGGQVRALVQLAGGLVAGGADAIKDISEGKRVTASLTSPSIYDNPLLAFYGSRGAMGLKISGGLVEAATNGKLDTLPYENVDTPAKLARNLALAALPFTLQGILEGEKPLTSALSMIGARTQAEARGEQRERISLEETGTAYSIMKPQQKKDFTTAHPELFAGAEEYPESAPQHHLIDIAETKATRMDALGKQLEAGGIDGQEYIDGRSTILTEAAIASAEYATGYESDNPYDQAFGEWQQIVADAKAANPAGVLTGTAFGELERQAEKDMGPEKWGMVEERRLASADPVEKKYLQDRAKMEPYWDLTDKLWEEWSGGDPALRDMTYQQFIDSTLATLKTENKGREWLARDWNLRSFNKWSEDGRTQFIFDNPDVEALLVKWGYNEVFHTGEGGAIYQQETGLEPRYPVESGTGVRQPRQPRSY